MLTRNSEWVLGFSARAALMWCDRLVLLLHRCNEATLEIAGQVATEYAARVSLMTDNAVEWEEMRMRQSMLDRARQDGTTHIAMVDDDEVLTANLLPSIRQWIADAPGDKIVQVPWLAMMDGLSRVVVGAMWGQQNVSLTFRDSPVWHWKAQNGYDFHHRHPMGWITSINSPAMLSDRRGGLMHLQFSSRERLIWKHILYQITERRRWPARDQKAMVEMYSRTVREADAAQMVETPGAWIDPYRGLRQYFHPESTPWQAVEVLRLAKENPGILDGLNTFGMDIPK